MLIEILIAVVLFSILSLGLMRTLGISLMSANVVNSILGEQDLRVVLSKTLTDFHCKKNLGSIGSINELKFYKDSNPSTTEGSVLIKKGDFKNMLDIVDMEFIDDPDDPTSNTKKFTVYFKRKKAKQLSTRGSGDCISDFGDPNDPNDDNIDKSGCYTHTCFVNYEVSGTDVVSCNLLDCFSVNKQSATNQDKWQEQMEGIILAKSCGKHYGWDVNNEKCVYTGRCKINRRGTSSCYYLEHNTGDRSDICVNWVNNSIHQNLNTPARKKAACADATSSPYVETGKRCVNDSNGECEK